MNKKRLLKLADFLETADLPGGFKMDMWSENFEDHGKLTCGTAACALGWATTIPSFRKAGLRMGQRGIPEFRSWTAIYAAEVFFDIPWSEAMHLFEPIDMSGLTGKRGRRIVASRIRQLVREAPKP